MAWFNPPTLQAGCVEESGATPAYTIDGAAKPRRIWELRVQSLAALRAALALQLFCCCFAVALLWLLLLRAGSALLLRDPWAAVRWGRSGRAAGESMDGLAFSRRQDARSKSPAPPHALAGQDARRAPTGVPFSLGYFSFGQAKEK